MYNIGCKGCLDLNEEISNDLNSKQKATFFYYFGYNYRCHIVHYQLCTAAFPILALSA